MHSGKPELRNHQQSFLPQTSIVLSATGSLELRLVSSAILKHTNNNTSQSWLGLVIVSNDRRTIIIINPWNIILLMENLSIYLSKCSLHFFTNNGMIRKTSKAKPGRPILYYYSYSPEKLYGNQLQCVKLTRVMQKVLSLIGFFSFIPGIF